MYVSHENVSLFFVFVFFPPCVCVKTALVCHSRYFYEESLSPPTVLVVARTLVVVTVPVLELHVRRARHCVCPCFCVGEYRYLALLAAERAGRAGGVGELLQCSAYCRGQCVPVGVGSWQSRTRSSRGQPAMQCQHARPPRAPRGRMQGCW